MEPLIGRTEHLRVLIANEHKDGSRWSPRSSSLSAIAREIDVKDVAAVTARERPDIALVGLARAQSIGAADAVAGNRRSRLLGGGVREAACPVIVLLHAPDLRNAT